jgi:hypothetical protein
MVHSPSKVWENGVLVERAVDPDFDPADPDEVEPQATKPYKAPTPTLSEVNRKRVASAENKAVKTAEKKASKK